MSEGLRYRTVRLLEPSEFELLQFNDLLEATQQGDKEAQKELHRIIAESFFREKYIPKSVMAYVMRGFHRSSLGESMTSAFSQKRRKSKSENRSRARRREFQIFQAVERNIEKGLVTSKDGMPGTAFDVENGLSRERVKHIYYKIKSELMMAPLIASIKK